MEILLTSLVEVEVEALIVMVDLVPYLQAVLVYILVVLEEMDLVLMTELL